MCYIEGLGEDQAEWGYEKSLPQTGCMEGRKVTISDEQSLSLFQRTSLNFRKDSIEPDMQVLKSISEVEITYTHTNSDGSSDSIDFDVSFNSSNDSTPDSTPANNNDQGDQSQNQQ